jgi:hypothetical protein
MKFKDLNLLAKEYKLTDLQKAFAENFVFVTGLDAVAAVELAGYKVTNDDYEYNSEQTKEIFKQKRLSALARELLNNPKILKYISVLREELNNQLIVDKLWVLKNLKEIVNKGSENAKLKSLELIGKHLEMWTDKSKVYDGIEDPSKIAKEAFEKRKQQNVVEFREMVQNE